MFDSVCQTYLDYLSDDDFLVFLEGFLEASLVSEHKEKTLAAIFNDHVIPNFLDVPTKSDRPPKLPFINILLSFFQNSSPASAAALLSRLSSLHPNNNTMWCFFLGHFSRLTRGADDNSFTDVVDGPGRDCFHGGVSAPPVLPPQYAVPSQLHGNIEHP